MVNNKYYYFSPLGQMNIIKGPAGGLINIYGSARHPDERERNIFAASSNDLGSAGGPHFF
jgi:hypothetical protein